jgi:glutamyl-tRNA synthetase
MPTFAHLPLLVGEDRKPLSKRHGSVAVDEFRRQGFLPEVLVNFLALCGWSYDATTERMTVDELVERFSFDRVGRNASFFDTAKLRSMNGDRIKELDDAGLAERLQPYFAEAGLVADLMTPDQQRLLLALAGLLRERIQVLTEAVELAAPYFRHEVVYDEKSVAKHLKGRAGEVLDEAEVVLADVGSWDGDAILAALDGIAERLEMGRGKVMQPVRVAVAGTAVSTPLPETLALLQRDLVLDRIRAAKPLVAS